MMMKVKVTQSCPTLCDPMDCSLPGSSVHRILQARILERVAGSLPSAGDLPNPGIEPRSPAWQADSLPLSCISLTAKIQEKKTELGHTK